MNVHELYTALSQQDRSAPVTIKNGKIHVGGKRLKIGDVEVETESETEGGSE